MTLAAGTRLGPYEIVGPLGAGGMGEVYRARDTRLSRDVAIKVLPRHLSAQSEVRARFEREARAISSLNHPNICVLHDVGRAPGGTTGEAASGDVDYLVMELVEGETLAARLARGALPTDETLRLGAQIADALDRAHRAGVIHRDLKPGNVMLTRAGAKLMDFGLARAATAVSGGSGARTPSGETRSPTVAVPLTAEGTIVGTFQYMAPEQLEGREADARSDLWALGCVLYEMATGRRAFDGATQASLISAIMRDPPRAMSELAPLNPPVLERLVRQCLAKDPEERLQSAHDVRLQLAAIAAGGPASSPGTRLALTGDDAGPPALSPDGRRLAFSAIGQGGGPRLWVRRMDEFVAAPLTGTEGATFPFWSPDGRSIGFFTSSALKRVDVEGGAVLTLCECNGPRGGTWSKDGVILFAPTFVSALMRVPASGGTPEPVTKLDSTSQDTQRWPQFMPDGRHFVYLGALHGDPHRSAIWFGSLAGERPRKLFDCPSGALYASGWLLFVRDSTLMAQRFDPGSGRMSGEPVPSAEVVHLDASTWRTAVTASETGLMVYGLGSGVAPCQPTWFDRSGQALRTIGEAGNYFNLALSPDGRRLLTERQIQPNADLWLEDLSSGLRTRVTDSPDDDSTPVWSPDGLHVAYANRAASGRYQLLERRSDAADEPATLEADSQNDLVPLAWSSDGRWLYFGRGDFGYTVSGALWRRSMAGDRRIEPVLPRSQAIGSAAISRDGRWLAYSSMTSGRAELMVVAAPAPGAAADTLSRRWTLTSDGGNNPCWRADGRELYYDRPDGTVVALAVDGGAPGAAGSGEFRVLSSTPLFQAFQRAYVRTLDAAPDGRHFAVSVIGDPGSAGLAVVSDWPRSLAGR